MNKKYRRTEVTETSARKFALAAAILFLHSSKPLDTRSEAWRLDDLEVQTADKVFKKRPMKIYDVDGRLLFRDFTTPLKDGREMRVRTVANSVLGGPVVSVGLGVAPPIQKLLKQARKEAKKRGLVAEGQPEGLVCYSYPRLGLLCRDSLGREKFVIELSDQSLFHVVKYSAARARVSLLTTWSPFDRVDTFSATMLRKQWAVGVKASQQRLANGVSLEELAVSAQVSTPSKVLARMALHNQDNLADCAAAAAWMIMDYNHVSLDKPTLEDLNLSTLRYISAALGIGEVGATNGQQIAGYIKLFGDKFTIAGDTPDFTKLHQEIGDTDVEGRPVKIGLQTHARVVGGWKIESDSSGKGIPWLYIYDPYPVSPDPYWEQWNSGFYTDLIFVRPTNGN